MADVFISYSHYDAEEANAIFDCLTRSGLSCSMDKEDLHGGDNWGERIVEEIDKCQLFVLIGSPHSNESQQVLSEVILARKRKKKIVPIKTSKVDFTGAMEYHLSAYQMIDASQGISLEAMNEVILQLSTSSPIPAANERNDYAPPRGIDIKGPKVFDLQEILDLNYSVNYIAMKEIQLDFLTVNPNKYKITDDVEGTSEMWADSIGLTADCSAVLIANNEIVGYMDFIPVSKEDYGPLMSPNRFYSKDVIAYFAYGGEFDVFVSMFSLDLNYLNPKIYSLFFAWMVQKLRRWKEEDIHIERIGFSIYRDSQAKALEALGFAFLLEDPIKGMLYEATYEKLLRHPVVIKRFLGE